MGCLAAEGSIKPFLSLPILVSVVYCTGGDYRGSIQGPEDVNWAGLTWTLGDILAYWGARAGVGGTRRAQHIRTLWLGRGLGGRGASTFLEACRRGGWDRAVTQWEGCVGVWWVGLVKVWGRSGLGWGNEVMVAVLNGLGGVGGKGGGGAPHLRFCNVRLGGGRGAPLVRVPL